MSSVYNSIMTGLQEAIDDAKSKTPKLQRRIVTFEPVKIYTSAEIKKIRQETGLSQKVFAGVLGVSDKTVEAWEAGTNHPSGAASRLLSILETDKEALNNFSFVKMSTAM